MELIIDIVLAVFAFVFFVAMVFWIDYIYPDYREEENRGEEMKIDLYSMDDFIKKTVSTTTKEMNHD